MLWLIWWLFISHGAFCSDLSSIDIYQSNVYSSSVQQGSRADFAVDDDLLEDKPTCFQTDNDLPDANGFHWFLIDFGYILPNVKEIRVVTETGYNLSEISAYTLRKPNLSLQQLMNASKDKATLDFESPDVVLCSSTGEVEPWRTATTIQCDQPRDGRWLALRRNEGVHICMVNVYVTQAYSMCFVGLRLEELPQRLAGVFRLIRHLTLGACRAACVNSSECDKVLYVQRNRYSGNCHLIRPVLGRVKAGDGVGQMVDRHVAAICQHNTCKYEGNRCHTGNRFNLTKRPNTDKSGGIKTHLLVDSSLESSEDWQISLGNSSFDNTNNHPQHLVSIHLRGSLICNYWNCGQVRVTAVATNGFETSCGLIETIELQQLDKLPLLCESSVGTFPIDITTVRIKWRAWHTTTTGGMTKLTLNMSGGHVRISTRPLPSKRLETMVPIAPIVPLIKIKTTQAVKDLKSSEMNDDVYMPLVYPTHLEQLTVIPKHSMTPYDAPSVPSPTKHPQVIDAIEVTERGIFVSDNQYESQQHQLYIGQEERSGAAENSPVKPYGKRGAIENTASSKALHKLPEEISRNINQGNCLSNSPLLVLTATLGVTFLFL